MTGSQNSGSDCFLSSNKLTTSAYPETSKEGALAWRVHCSRSCLSGLDPFSQSLHACICALFQGNVDGPGRLSVNCAFCLLCDLGLSLNPSVFRFLLCMWILAITWNIHSAHRVLSSSLPTGPCGRHSPVGFLSHCFEKLVKWCPAHFVVLL